MCGRYTLTASSEEIAERFLCPQVEQGLEAHYNVAPSQIMPVVLERDGQRQLKMMRWGLLPFWAKEPGLAGKLINARVETLEEKASFKYALKERRCIIPADGYYEWQNKKADKQPVHITMPSRQLFAFAGLWEQWRDNDGKVILSYTIITTAPVSSLASIHKRMPLILKPEQEDYWLQGWNGKNDALARLFLNKLKPSDKLIAYPVSKRVNNPKNNGPLCIEPLE